MKHKKQSRRWIAVFLTCAMLFTLSGVAEAWENYAPDPYGSPYRSYTLSGSIDVGGGFVVSATGQQWSHQLSMWEVFEGNDPYIPPQAYPHTATINQAAPFNCTLRQVSFDPDTLNQMGNGLPAMYAAGQSQMYANLPATVCTQQPGSTTVDAQIMYSDCIRYGVFYVQRDIWQTYGAQSMVDPSQALNFGCYFQNITASGLHVLFDLRILKNVLFGNDPMATMPDWIICGEPYAPLNIDVNSGDGNSGTWQDTNNDGICTADEIQSGLTIGAQVNPNQWMPLGGYSNTISANSPIPIPVLLWDEGQSPCMQQNGDPQQSVLHFFMDDVNQAISPLDTGMCYSTSGMYCYGVTGLSFSLPQWTYGLNTASDISQQTLLQLQQSSGFMMEDSVSTLYLPSNIDGRMVNAVDQRVLEDAAQTGGSGPIQTIIVPDSAYVLTGTNCTGMTPVCLQRLHLPTGIQFDDLIVNSMTTVCTSTDDPVLRQYCQTNGIPYEVCAGHVPMHTHVFDDVVVTPPTYHAAGYTTYTCTGCGGSYQTAGSAALDVPTLTLQGGSAEPGDTVDVTVALTDNGGLDGITLMPQYDPQTLTLEAVSAASQDWTTAIVPGANDALPTVTVTPDTTFSGTTLCTLTFRAAADAAEGQQTVGMTATLTPPAAHVDISPVTLSAAQTNISVLPSAAVPALEMTAGSGTPGSLVSVTVSVRDNPGVIAMLLEANYDASALELMDVVNGTVFGAELMEAGGDKTAVPYRVCWSDNTAQSQNNTTDGDLVTFRFRVLPGAAEGNHAVTVSLVSGSTFNTDLEDVAFTPCTAQVTVSALRGDANGDGMIDMRDAAAIIRSLRDPQQTVAPINADVNGDGIVDRTDAMLIRKYVVRGHGVVLP